MRHTRREFLTTAGAVGAACALAGVSHAGEKPSASKHHIVTLSFDDGFKKSSVKTAEITRSTSCRPASTWWLPPP